MSTTSPTARVRVPRIAGSAFEQARLSVVPRLRRPTPRVPFVSLVVTLLVLGVAGLLMFNTSLQQASFTAAALETQAMKVTAERQALERELQLLRNPQRVAERAQKLGMVPAAAPAFLRLDDGTVLGNPVPARAEDRMAIQERDVSKPRFLDPEPVVVRVPARTAPDPVRPRAGRRGADQ
ncbi:hypothetical protein [Nocardioides massiliensis]|uniref:Cell division protein FtsB n=1 Tax=Nocardioides massiliensis TaxID=1325935 RepID=A0ABT9NU12_9ACTN|nr:hypothetical protein [Nocardioides massiliensis]MDP9823515.1 cell division protein FtsB [Nocardioides massiliensis]